MGTERADIIYAYKDIVNHFIIKWYCKFERMMSVARNVFLYYSPSRVAVYIKNMSDLEVKTFYYFKGSTSIG